MKEEELLKKWLLDKLSEEEQKSFMQSAEYARLIKIWDGLPEVATPPQLDIERELERFRSVHPAKTKTRVVKVSWGQRLIGIAASLVIVSVLSYLLFNESIDGSTSVILAESHVELFLPDSSVVVLNKGSELAYNEESWSDHRIVRLEGEGYFQVNKGSTFDVATSDGVVSVLGTSFNVKQRDQVYEIVCFEGSVGVKTNNHRADLIAGQGFQLIEGDTTAFKIVPGNEPDWINGKSTFYKIPYHAVLSELENQYDVKVEARGLNIQNTFSGSFPNDNLEIALDAVTTPSGYQYQVNENIVLIFSEAN